MNIERVETKPLNWAVITYVTWAVLDFGLVLLIAIIILTGFTAHSAGTREITVYLSSGILALFAVSILSKIAYGLRLEMKFRQKKKEERLEALQQALEVCDPDRTARETALAKLTAAERKILGL